ncbi:MAG: CDP-diacylglycerol--serine O-phosphatidyltransferase [Candidatus Euphemobacter frigidus]|nr:CDP-diacylglycerol--serine O-phosphatidyltransferase [Candidatus Euphemobacter frigidus]MDP8274854.1 CDP-diacylglycerol--serine O-phosphatidyltransferase [Candidatus Euphemobacter frigidus]
MKKIYILPNLFTTANVFCGVYALTLILRGDPHLYIRAAWFLLLAMIFDFIDGQLARFYKATTRFGVEFDSLADFFSFGVVTTVLAYRIVLQHLKGFGIGVAFLYIVFCALRLARFNIQVNKEEKTDFKGLPSPVAAGVVLSFIIFNDHFQLGWEMAIPFIMIVLSSLMVTSITYPTLLTLNLRKKKPFLYLVAIVLILVILITHHQIGVFVAFISYLILGLYQGIRLEIRERRKVAGHPALPRKIG